MKVVFLDKASLGDDLDYSLLHNQCHVEMYSHTSAEEVVKRAYEAEVIITNKVVLGQKHLERLKQLKLIIVTATGVNNIAMDTADSLGIEVKNAIGYAKNAVAYHTFAMYFKLNQDLSSYQKFSAELNWSSHHSFSFFEDFHDLSDQTWGIIGLGDIGTQVARIASSFGAEIIYYSSSGQNNSQEFERVSLDELLQRAHIISLHCALVKETRCLIARHELEKMQVCHTLLNVSRGDVLDEHALANHIRRSHLKVGLDVLSHEPWIERSPLKSFIQSGRILLTPHMSWASKASRQRLLVHIEQNLKNFIEKN